MINETDLVTVSHIAEKFEVTPATIRIWRYRYDDFPEPAMELRPSYNLYRMSEMWDWYIVRWPDRIGRLTVYLHRFTIDDVGPSEPDTSEFGPAPEARGYLKAVRDFQYEDWRIWFTGMGFVAEKDGVSHLWALDPSPEPEDWFIYEQRYKAVERRE